MTADASVRRVVLCGSLNRHAHLMDAAATYYSSQGNEVIVPRRDRTVSEQVHADRWYAQIDRADLVVHVTDHTGYLGDQTGREMRHAEHKGVATERWQAALPIVSPFSFRPAMPPADTPALREQVADVLNRSTSTPFANKVSLAAATDAVLSLFAEREATHAEVARTWEAYRLRSVEQKREWRRKVTSAEEAERKLNQAIVLVGDLMDGEPCRLDHNGNCQEHYSFGYGEYECVDARAKRWLAELDKTAAPTTGPAPAAADGTTEQVHWGVQRDDGVLDQMDDEDDARGHLTWLRGEAHLVSRVVKYGPWQPVASQDPTEPTDTAASAEVHDGR